jgi:hypothetical protein
MRKFIVILYIMKGFLIYEEMCKYFTIYEWAVSHIWLYNCVILNFLYMRKILFSYFPFYQCMMCPLNFNKVYKCVNNTEM